MQQMYETITISNRTDEPGEKLSLEQFINHPCAQTPAGLLFLALLEENVWSQDFKVTAFFEQDRNSVFITSPLLMDTLGNHEQFIYEERGTCPSVQEVAKILLQRIADHRTVLQIALASFRKIEEDLGFEITDIERNLARSQILNRIPGLTTLNHIPNHWKGTFFDVGGKYILFISETELFWTEPTIFKIDVPVESFENADPTYKYSLIANANPVKTD
jgi:hypothetical protein